MPVFISYSHADKDFVTRLAGELVRHRVHVWIDQWELKVGDSLLTKVQDAITGASALLVVLSKASVKSEWCTKELNAGLMRELDEKRVIVLPILVEDCAIPIFLREKMHADFRADFDAGLKQVLKPLAAVTNESMARLESPLWHTDWSIDYGDIAGKVFVMTVVLVEQAKTNPYSILAEIEVVADRKGSKNYLSASREERAGLRRELVGELVSIGKNRPDFEFWLDDPIPQRREIEFEAKSPAGRYQARVICRWLGQDTGGAVLYRLGEQLAEIYERMREVAFRPTEPPRK